MLPSSLAINLRKTVVYAPSPETHESASLAATERTIRCETRGSIVVSGTRISSVDYETEKVKEAIEEVAEKMPNIVNAATILGYESRMQSAFRVQRLCFAFKLTHLLRSVPPRSTVAAAKTFDGATFRSVLQLVGQAPPDPDSAFGRAMNGRVLLPISEGGMGLQSLSGLYWLVRTRQSTGNAAHEYSRRDIRHRGELVRIL